MAKTKQAAIRRKLAQAVNDCNRVVDNLGPIAEMFEDAHPDMAELLKVICVSQALSVEMIGTFALKAWGRIPEDWEAWRNPRTPKSKVTDAKTNGR